MAEEDEQPAAAFGTGKRTADAADMQPQWKDTTKRPRKSVYTNDHTKSRHQPARDAAVPNDADGADDDDEDSEGEWSPGADDDEDIDWAANLAKMREAVKTAQGGAHDDAGDEDEDDEDLYHRLGDLSDAGGSEQHEYTHGEGAARGAGRPGAHDADPLPPGVAREDIVEKQPKKGTLEDMVNFEGYDLPGYRKAVGDDIRRDPREVALIRKADERVQARLKGAAPDDDDVSSIFGKSGNENYVVGRCRCRICKHSGLGTHLNRLAASNAYWSMIDYDLRKLGYVPDEDMYQDLTDIFNKEQEKVAVAGGRAFYVDVVDVRDHMGEHYIANPMRVPANQLRFCAAIIKELRPLIFGTGTASDGTRRRVCLRENLKVTLQVMKHQLVVNREFAALRSEVNNSLANGGTGGGGRRGHLAGATRHISSGAANKPLS